MPTNTYIALDKATVTVATPSITFSAIPQGYTDLVVIVNGLTSSANAVGVSLFINGGTSTGRSLTRVQGDGTSATSLRSTTDAVIGVMGDSQSANLIINIMNYSNTTTFKTILSRYNTLDSGDARVGAYVSLSQSTTAITSLTLSPAGVNFAVGSTFSLYGIAASSVGAKATGGIISSDSQYFYHTFAASGTFTPTQSLSADCLVVAGGGGGGATVGGGGGAGGLLGFNSQSLTATNYTITVGAGGAGGAGPFSDGALGADSQFAALTLVKGGGGGGGFSSTNGKNGLTGGSGGGAGGTNAGTAGTGGSATSGQGFAGGSGGNIQTSGAFYTAGGGGGASAVGVNAINNTTAGIGGAGSSAYSSWGTATGTGQNVSGTYYYAGGGGGASSNGQNGGGTVALGGLGGGGNGGINNPATAATTGLANTGGGGGGQRDSNSGNGAAGGSGIVIIRYLKA